MGFLKEIYTTEGRLNRRFHLNYQILWSLIAITVEYILYLISDVSISPPEGIFIAMFPAAWSLIASVLMLITFVIMNILINMSDIWLIMTIIWVIVTSTGNFMLMTRRLHDLGKSGYLALIALIPGISLVFSIYLFCAAGQVGSNQYGEDPIEN